MLVQSSSKVSQFLERLSSRVQELEEIEEANEQVQRTPHGKKLKTESGDIEMSHDKVIEDAADSEDDDNMLVGQFDLRLLA